MNFKEAMEALKSGSKVTRKSWIGSVYFEMKENEIKGFNKVTEYFQYDESIMISDKWKIEGIEGNFYFYEIIDFLSEGKNAYLETWDQMFISYERSSQNIILHSMKKLNYQPSFESFTSTDWIIIND